MIDELKARDRAGYTGDANAAEIVAAVQTEMGSKLLRQRKSVTGYRGVHQDWFRVG